MNFSQFIDRFPAKYKRLYFFAGKHFFVNECVMMVRDYVNPDTDFDFIRLYSPNEAAVIDALREQSVTGSRLVIVEEPLLPEKWSNAAKWVERLPKDISVVFWTSRDDIDTKNDFIQTVIRKGFYVMCKDLDQYEGELHEWVKKELDPADEGAVNEIVQHLGSNYAAIRMEAKKLRTVTSRHLDAQTVTKLLGYPEPRDVFDLLESIGDRDKKRALETSIRIESSSSGLGFVGLLEHRFRQLILVHYLRSRGLENRDIIIRLKIHRFYAGQIMKLAKQFPAARCRKALLMLQEVDRKFRRGYAFKQVIPVFIVELLDA